MVKISVTVCDVCKREDRRAKTYKVQSEGRTVTTDRCPEHGAALEELFDKAPKRPGRPSARMATIEEIEARKAAKSRR